MLRAALVAEDDRAIDHRLHGRPKHVFRPIGCNGSAFPWTVRGDDGRLGFGTRVGVVTRCIGDDYPSSSPRRVVIGTAPSIAGATKRHGHAALDRSEEHTSELQSRDNLVC